jgi:hypothetical protein
MERTTLLHPLTHGEHPYQLDLTAQLHHEQLSEWHTGGPGSAETGGDEPPDDGLDLRSEDARRATRHLDCARWK